MTCQEALKCMKEGKRVQHRYFCYDEFIFILMDHIFTEEEIDCGTEKDEFWTTRSQGMFLDGWRIFKSDEE